MSQQNATHHPAAGDGFHVKAPDRRLGAWGCYAMVSIELIGGGPGDGQKFEVASLEQERKLQEKRYGDGFFWVYLYSCNPDGSDPHIYVEAHPHDEPDFMPPKVLELWYTQQIALSDLQ